MMTETINKIEEINDIFIEVLKLEYIGDNEDYFYNEVSNFYIEEKLSSNCELQTKRELIAFIIKNGKRDLPNMLKNDEENFIKEAVKYYMKNNEESFIKRVVKYYIKNIEKVKKIISTLLTCESFKKLIEQVKKEDFLNFYMENKEEVEKNFQLIFTNEMKKEFNIENAEEAVKYYMENTKELKKLIEQHLLKNEVRERIEQHFFTSKTF